MCTMYVVCEAEAGVDVNDGGEWRSVTRFSWDGSAAIGEGRQSNYV